MTTAISRRCAAALLLCTLAACGGATAHVAAPAAVPEPPPEPPADALAWLPVDASVLGRIDLAAFRTTPFAKHLPELDEPSTEWLDLDRVDVVSVALEPHGDDEPSVVGVLSGTFGADYLKDKAVARGKAPVMHGAQAVYEHDGTFWVQPRPELLVGCTADRVDWVLGRYTAGEAVPLRDTALFADLAPAVEFETANVAVLLQDQDGSARRALEQAGGAQMSFVTRALAHVGRAAVRVQFADGVALDVLADVDTEAHAQQLLGLLQGYLDRWTNSPLILLLGLHDLLAGITVNATGTRVSLNASVTQVEIDALVERLKPMIEGLFDGPARTPQPVAPAAAQPAPQPAPVKATQEAAGD